MGGVPYYPKWWEESHLIPCGCGRSSILSHVVVGEVPSYPKLWWGKSHLIPCSGGTSPILSHVVVDEFILSHVVVGESHLILCSDGRSVILSHVVVGGVPSYPM